MELDQVVLGQLYQRKMLEPGPLSSVSLKPSHHGCEAVVELQERWRPYHWNLSQATGDHTDVLNRGICSKCGSADLFDSQAETSRLYKSYASDGILLICDQ
ncbi:hypothetical protein EYF80_002884 [Liparis tanakae]|uniref:Uncharacterized protein n=1 Tax=Liparis tanakae TaxID=230148 RepID=A0A4Z2J9V1_9TELE|nr:hypothetical protein EYF80_002884 [Liparis tanakae]